MFSAVRRETVPRHTNNWGAMCNYREVSRDETAVLTVLAGWHKDDRLGMQKDFQGNAELLTISRGLPSEIIVTDFIHDAQRPQYPCHIEFMVVSGRGGFHEGERFRLTPRMASALYEKAPALV
jgi:hypothetical protein